MSSLLTQVLIYMTSTFILGLLMGCVVWSHRSNEERKTLTLEIDFWKNHLNQTRLERDRDIDKIDALTKDKVNLKKKLAATGS